MGRSWAGGALSSLVRRQTDDATIIPTLNGDRQDRADFFDVLSTLWVEGVPLKWTGLGEGSGKRKVILLTYPFETKNYWIDPPVFQPERGTDRAPEAETPQAEAQWLHVPAWRKKPLRTPVLSADEGWLIFEDDAGLGAQLRKRLGKSGARVFSLEQAERFEQAGPDAFRVRPGVAEDLVAVLQAGATSGWTPRQIVHLWLANGGRNDTEDPFKTFDACLRPGFETLTALVRALDEHGADEQQATLTVVADGVAALEGEDEPLCWEKASLLGPCRVAPLEMPSLSCQLVDVPAAARSAAWLADGLLAEASAMEPGTFKALREDGRYIETFRPLADSFGGGIRSGGVALITGGVGGARPGGGGPALRHGPDAAGPPHTMAAAARGGLAGTS